MTLFDKKQKLLSLSTVNATINDDQNWSKKITVDPEMVGSDFWTARVAFTNASWGGTGYTLSGYGFVVAGTSNGTAANTANNRYSDTTNTALSKTVITTGRWFVGGFALNGLGYVCGGQTPDSRVEMYNDFSNAWTRRHDLTTARFKQGSFVQDGFAYQCCGQTAAISGAMVNTVEQFNDTSNTWSSKATAGTAIEGAGGMALNGFGFLTGGNRDNVSDYAGLTKYNTSLNSWTVQQGTAVVTDGRTLHSCWAINGLGYISFGRQNTTLTDIASHEEYNDVTDNFLQKRNSSTVRFSPKSYTLNGYGYCLHGGNTSTGAVLANGTHQQYRNFNWYKVFSNFKHSFKSPKNVYVSTSIANKAVALPIQISTDNSTTINYMTSNRDTINPLTNTTSTTLAANVSGCRNYEISVGIPEYMAGFGGNVWTQRAAPNNTHRDPASFSTNGYGYVSGGYDGANTISLNDLYNDSTDAWTSKAALTTARRQVAGMSFNGFGYAINGATTATSGNTNIVELYNDVSNAWSNKARTTTAVKNSSCAFALNGLGYTANGTTNALESYNDTTDVWTSLSTSGVTQRTFPAPFALNGFGYQVCGGGTTETNQYNDAANTWTTKAVCGSTNKDGVGGFYLSGFGYAVGGNNGATFTSEVFQYNDAANVWNQKPGCGTVRASLSYFSLNKSGYTGHGATTGTVDSVEFWRMAPTDNIVTLSITARIEE